MRLHPNTYVAAVGDDLVFLDVAQDEYFCLPAAAALIALDEDGVTVRKCDGELLDQLLGAGLVLRQSDVVTPADRTPLATPGRTDLLGDRQVKIRPADVARMALAAMRLYWHAPRGTLLSLVKAARPVRVAGPGPCREDPLDLARRCEHLLPWIPFQGECLFRSFLTVTALRRAGVAVSWVFGVQTWPFRAHCWLQIGDVVVNDAAERVSGYVPIMVA
ncbi:MAG: lasso peptide biosynthesis B2 protein [Proteobacteria bacterium]|nr:lasso peptide biosynthesis B2 protein [Pseudomonadota bacterium]